MASDLFVEMEYFQLIKHGQAACGDDVQLEARKQENRYLAVLSDGLGSGIKANVLANMTTTMGLKFLKSNLDVMQSVEIIMDSLPVCEVRHISYSTFSMVDLRLGGITRLVEMGNPQYIQLRGTKEIQPLKHETLISQHWPDREVECYELKLEPGDRLIVCSDGVTQSGLGEGAPYKFGWRRCGELEYAQEQIAANPNISSKSLAHSIAGRALMISKGVCHDDITCLVIYLREPRVLRVLTGPPFYKESDAEYAAQANLGEEHTVICGGTTANILERELGKKVEIDLHQIKKMDNLPPPGRIPGVGLATEGILTLSRVAIALEEETPVHELPQAARKVIERFLEHDRIEFIVGTKVNEAHQDPTLPEDLELRRGIVHRLRNILTSKYRKEVVVNYY